MLVVFEETRLAYCVKALIENCKIRVMYYMYILVSTWQCSSRSAASRSRSGTRRKSGVCLQARSSSVPARPLVQPLPDRRVGAAEEGAESRLGSFRGKDKVRFSTRLDFPLTFTLTHPLACTCTFPITLSWQQQ